MPYERAKLRQFFEDARKKENDKSKNTCNDAAVLLAQEDVPLEVDKGTKPLSLPMLEINLAMLLMNGRSYFLLIAVNC
jgi:hypothetical protein